MLRKMMVLVGMLALAGTSRAVLVDGYAFLGGQTNHEGIKVLFEATSPSAVTDSTYTDSSGYYQLDVAGGFYDVHFTYADYTEEILTAQNLFSPQTLPDVYLHIDIPGGSLSGTMEAGWYFVQGNISVNYGSTLTLEPGVTFFFEGNYEFTINGVLLAEGTAEDSIRFMLGEGVTG
jgi:hypothetical protein